MKNYMEKIEKKIADILGLERTDGRWILYVYAEGTGKAIDYTDEVKKLAQFIK